MRSSFVYGVLAVMVFGLLSITKEPNAVGAIVIGVILLATWSMDAERTEKASK